MRFEEGIRSKCLVTIPKGSAAYADIVNIFTLGNLAHITVADAGVMSLDLMVTLKGFSKSFNE